MHFIEYNIKQTLFKIININYMSASSIKKNKKVKRDFFSSSIIIIIITLFFICSCSNAYIQPQSATKLIENIPFYPQEDYQCGPASLAGVLNYHGVVITPEEIAADIFSKSAKGTLNLDMLIYAKNKGFKALQYKGSIDDIRININKGLPLIVLVDYGFLFYMQNHFMVIIGYNDYGIIVNSYAYEKQFIALDRFLDAWEKTNFWTLLIKSE